jgi:hypothetical protein
MSNQHVQHQGSGVLFEVQNLRGHQRRQGSSDGERPGSNGRFLFPGWLHREDLQNHPMNNPTDVDK